jgi:prepilin signal peptidase PulO-like enzyme (type II secretory pathway)
MLNRACPVCGRRSISVFKLMLWRVRCAHCQADIGTHPAWRLPVLSIEMMAWLLALNWLYRDYGRTGLVLSLVLWAVLDLLADYYVPLVARRR